MQTASSILVIDNDEAILQLIQDVLAPDYEVVTTNDPHQVLDLLIRKHFDLLIVDLFFPTLDGLDLIRTVRAISTLMQMPILAISASEKLEEVHAGEAQAILAKPFALDELSRAVTRALHPRKCSSRATSLSAPL